jgi:DNA-directed RNA polymerase specialized sigma24 family protein
LRDEHKMRSLDKTTMGGNGSLFRTTHWSQIRNARTDDKTRRRIIIGSLYTTYWRPVYSYLRRKGYHNEEAKDLSQDFFEEVVLGRQLIQSADEAKGKFRTLLLTALERYTVEVHRRKTRKKNLPEAGFVYLDPDEMANLPTVRTEIAPENAFHHAWVADLLDQVLAEVEEEYCSTNRKSHWAAFNAKIINPIFNDVKAPSLSKICKLHGISDEIVASNMITTVKRRFRSVLKRRLRNFVQSDSDIEEEIQELYKILAGSSAG